MGWGWSCDVDEFLSVADYNDTRLLYCLRYFIELKFPGISLLTPENCGQVLDYFNKAREKQPHRAEFVAVLSDFNSAMAGIGPYLECLEARIANIYLLMQSPKEEHVDVIPSRCGANGLFEIYESRGCLFSEPWLLPDYSNQKFHSFGARICGIRNSTSSQFMTGI